jgi:photosystem II stability/assembly factor-like uncharacterized protein
MKYVLLAAIFLVASLRGLSQTWTELNTGLGETLMAVYVTPEGTVMVAGTGGLFATSYDGGETWTEIDATDGEDIEDIHFFNEDEGLILIKDAVFLSDDGGQSFPFIATVSGEFIDFDFSDNTHGWAVGKDGSLNYTTDAGQTWNPESPGTNEDLEAVSFTDNLHGIAVGKSSVARMTTNGGFNWSNAGVNGNEDFAATAFVDVNHAWIAGGNGEIFSTSNGGSSWSMQFSPVNDDLLCMSFVDASNGFIAGDNGTIISTTDGGNMWNLNTTTVSVPLNDIFMASEDYGFAVGDNGTVLRLGSIPTAIGESNTIRPVRAYPNPATDFILVEVNGQRVTTVELVDATGRIISRQVSQSEVRFDVIGLQSGIYFITTIDAAGAKYVSKIVKQ